MVGTNRIATLMIPRSDEKPCLMEWSEKSFQSKEPLSEDGHEIVNDTFFFSNRSKNSKSPTSIKSITASREATVLRSMKGIHSLCRPLWGSGKRESPKILPQLVYMAGFESVGSRSCFGSDAKKCSKSTTSNTERCCSSSIDEVLAERGRSAGTSLVSIPTDRFE